MVEKSIIADKTIVGANCHLGVGEYAPSTLNEKVYASDLVTIGEDSVIPDGVSDWKKYSDFRSNGTVEIIQMEC